MFFLLIKADLFLQKLFPHGKKQIVFYTLNFV